ncbi:KH domain-containing protein [Candidatus Dojkabacteria bacterium]|nr:KH domain-containing protein [Candidatus Dojkabacteria bacterium]
MIELIKHIIESIVNSPEDIKIEELDGEMPNVKVYKISVKEEDKGLVIGKHGRTINAIRDIIKIKAIKTGIRAVLELE